MSLPAPIPDGFSQQQFLELLEAAKDGCAESLGKLIQASRQYLLAVANQELPAELRAKVAPSDLVQDSCLEAQQGFATFAGKTREELLAWLRGILIFNLSNVRRHYTQTAKRQTGLEISIQGGYRRRGEPLPFVAQQPSPSQEAMAKEEQELIETLIMRLPELPRRAVLLRNKEHLTFAEIGQVMHRSADSARKLWARGIEQLQNELKAVRSQNHE